MPFFLGIDGGGTRTTAWLADERGRVLGRGAAGPSNPLKVGFPSCQREILRAAKCAVASSYRRRAAKLVRRYKAAVTLDAVVVGLAGVDRRPVHRKIFAWLRRHAPARRHLLTSDAAITLQAALGGSPGVIVISGTGSIAFARSKEPRRNGRLLRAGGWGTLYDDAGSGYDLGRQAIAAALRDLDGRRPRTELRQRICTALRLKCITQVILKPLDPQQIAALFPLVLESARRGDPVARRLLEGAGQNLAELALALLRRLRWTRRAVPVVCAGGVFRTSPEVLGSFIRHVRRHAPRARVRLLRREPVEGALDLARQLARSRVDHSTLRADRV
jgi:N-acetylglucosamine kinase-like BadF-type ATPase